MKPPTVRFEPLATDVIEPLLDLWIESWSEVYAGIDFSARRHWFRDHVAHWQADGGLTRIARCQGQLTGMILLKPATGHLDQICVARAFKGAGVAPALMAEARRLSPAGLHLEVNATNRRAIAFYVREGFMTTGAGVNPTSGLPTLLMAWRP